MFLRIVEIIFFFSMWTRIVYDSRRRNTRTGQFVSQIDKRHDRIYYIGKKKKKYAKHILNSLNYTLKCRINWSLRIGSGISKKNIVSKHILKIPSIKKQKLFPCISLTILFYKLSDRYGNLPWNISISNTMIELLQRHLLLLLYSV